MANINQGVPKYRSYLKEKEIHASKEMTEEEKEAKAQKRLALSQNEINFREYCKELNQMAVENKEKEAAKKKKEREKMYAIGTEDNEADQPDTIMKGKIMSTYERTKDIERNFREARKLVDPKDDPSLGFESGKPKS